MIIYKLLLIGNPFFTAYAQSDLVGKTIFAALLALSIICWTVLIYHFLLAQKARRESAQFRKYFEQHRGNPLAVLVSKNHSRSPYLAIYMVLKKYIVDILNKNRAFSPDGSTSLLSPTDLDFVDTHADAAVADQTQKLEKNLYILSTIVTLAPFLGLLGTVWGILVSFGEMQSLAGGNTNQTVLGGLSLALTTTVLGLIDAIPALIGYNYLKHLVRDFQMDMEIFSNEILTSVELQYRQVDVK